jgi:hypothetical protein
LHRAPVGATELVQRMEYLVRYGHDDAFHFLGLRRELRTLVGRPLGKNSDRQTCQDKKGNL